MLKKILVSLCLAAMLLFPACAHQPVAPPPVEQAAVCTMDHSKLPQQMITTKFGMKLLRQLKADDREVFGTAQDIMGTLFIWYRSDNGHRCAVINPEQNLFFILSPEEGYDLYLKAKAQGYFPKGI